MVKGKTVIPITIGIAEGSLLRKEAAFVLTRIRQAPRSSGQAGGQLTFMET